MPITVTMIEEKEFKTKVRGYDPVEVDEFLDDICDEMISMQETIQSLREKLKQQETQPAFTPPLPMAAPAPLAPTPAPQQPALPHDVESARLLLEKTQLACDETLAHAKKRAEEIIREAEDMVPDPELTELEAQRDRLREEIEGLKGDLHAFRSKFRSLLQTQNDLLDEEIPQ